VKPPSFDYGAPSTLEEALTLMGELGDEARPLAGGQSLVPLLALRLARPSYLVDLAGIPELTSIRVGDGQIVLGSMLRERAAERDGRIAQHAPLLADALPLIGHAAIRSRGTVGGSLAHADPAAELPAAALVLDATLVAESNKRGQRMIPAADFFTGFLTTCLEPDEILTGVRIPSAPAGTGTAFEEVARRHGDFAMVGVAGSVRLAGDGSIGDVRLALTGVSDVPVRALKCEAALVGSAPAEAVIMEAAALVADGLAPPSDLHASAAYRKRVAGVLVRRVLRTAIDRARAAA
jgi:carbon-monoxide dehydrogenase medium subunit